MEYIVCLKCLFSMVEMGRQTVYPHYGKYLTKVSEACEGAISELDALFPTALSYSSPLLLLLLTSHIAFCCFERATLCEIYHTLYFLFIYVHSSIYI